ADEGQSEIDQDQHGVDDAPSPHEATLDVRGVDRLPRAVGFDRGEAILAGCGYAGIHLEDPNAGPPARRPRRLHGSSVPPTDSFLDLFALWLLAGQVLPLEREDVGRHLLDLGIAE